MITTAPIWNFEVFQEFGSVAIDLVDRPGSVGLLSAIAGHIRSGRCDRKEIALLAHLYQVGCTNEIALHADRALLFGLAHLHVLDELAVSVR